MVTHKFTKNGMNSPNNYDSNYRLAIHGIDDAWRPEFPEPAAGDRTGQIFRRRHTAARAVVSVTAGRRYHPVATRPSGGFFGNGDECMRADVAVIGGGMFGAALAFGLRRAGRDVVMIDEGDNAHRAARGNFGLVWVQSKGIDSPTYAAWTRRSANAWTDFAAELSELTGVDTHHRRPGGLDLCLGEDELEERRQKMQRLAQASEGAFTYEMLDRSAVEGMVPGIGPDVVGASYSPHDGDANPLNLLRALHAGYRRLEGRALVDRKVLGVRPDGDGFEIKLEDESLRADQVVLAAGLGNKQLATGVGIDAPIAPLKGEIMVTEKVQPFLDYPLSRVRQTAEGGVLIGDSHEDVGLENEARPSVMAFLAHRARRMFPFLAEARIVRAWGAIRPMLPDGLPLYQQSETAPGAFIVAGHSGVTLAAVHATVMAPAIAEGRMPNDVAPLNLERFNVH